MCTKINAKCIGVIVHPRERGLSHEIKREKETYHVTDGTNYGCVGAVVLRVFHTHMVARKP